MRKRVIVISLILAAVVAAVMVPRLRSSQFGILDDGVTLEFARLLSASMSDGDLSLFWRLEAERGRFRPFYWLYNTILYSIWRQDPFGYFLTNALVLLFTALSVAATVALATRNTLASLVAGLTYVLSPPVMENYFTLSKPEVPLTFLLGLSLCCWAGARASLPHAPRRSRSLLTVSALFLLGAYLTKETAQAMLLVSALWVSVLWVRRGIVDRRTEQLDSWYLGANLACVAIFWITRVMTGTVPIATGGDSRHYAVTAATLVATTLGHLTWYFRDFPALLALLIFLWWRMRKPWQTDLWLRLVPVFWILSWTLIMLPWHSIHEYYLLPATLGVSLIVGPGIACVFRSLSDPQRSVRLWARTLFAITLILVPFVLGNMMTNGRIQLAVDAGNARLIDFLAITTPRKGTVLVNIPAPNEYMDEIALHLRVLKDRHDVRVAYADDRDIVWDEVVLVVSPIMRNKPIPSVRVAVSDADARESLAKVQARAGGRMHRVYRQAERIRLRLTQIQKPFCLFSDGAKTVRDFVCPSREGFFDTRAFEYGWEAYRLRAR